MRDQTLPVESGTRKDYPLWRGCLAYFPAALAGVARWSKLGNDKHNPGEPIHHARGKSNDHQDCIARHLLDLGDALRRLELNRNEDPLPALAEADALAWRALALSQILHELLDGAPLAPAAREPEPVKPGEMGLEAARAAVDRAATKAAARNARRRKRK